MFLVFERYNTIQAYPLLLANVNSGFVHTDDNFNARYQRDIFLAHKRQRNAT